MAKQNIDNYLSAIVVTVGLIIIGAGIYYKMHSLTSSGVTMGRYGRPYGTGTIDGNGMIFCGVIIGGLGFILRNKKGKNDNGEDE